MRLFGKLAFQAMHFSKFVIFSGPASGTVYRILGQRQAGVSAPTHEWKRDNYEK
jgi:hypothetical protein